MRRRRPDDEIGYPQPLKHASQIDRARVLEHFAAVDLEALANWMSVFPISFCRCTFRSFSGSFRRSYPLR